MILDHIGLSVADYQTSKAFYSRVLELLGIGLVMEVEGNAGFGREGKPEFWFGEDKVAQKPLHIAFTADSRKQVDAFYETALAAGARNNGPPGVRKIYHPDYYGAFVLDPDGHNIEAVCHASP